MEIRSATPNDVAAVERLLLENKLPTVGVKDAIGEFLVARSGDDVIGVVGMEYCCNYGLLRSTAVAPEWRGKGIARQLVERIIARAESRGIHALYLLTTTAETYFPTFGFRETKRESVPADVQGTDEFKSACPASATVMSLELNGAAV